MTNERPTVDDGRDPVVDAEITEIEADIQDTRAEMGDTLDEIGLRLDPSRLAEEAREKVRDATVGRVEEAVENAGETAKGVSDMLIETVRRNPVPAAMAGVGLLLLWQNRSTPDQARDSRNDRFRSDGIAAGAREGIGSMGDRAGEMASGAQEFAGDVADTAREGANQLGSHARRILNDAPLVAGIAAVGAGAAVGALLPDTPIERDLIGEQSGELIRAAGDVASQLGERAQEAIAPSAV